MKKRGTTLTVLAVLLTLMVISNLTKPIQGGNAGFVFFGTKTTGLANEILGPLFGIYLLIYVVGIFLMRNFALPMGIAYAAYVPVNLLLFTIKHAGEPYHGWHRPNGEGSVLFALIYMAIAVGVSSGAALILWTRRSQLAR
jgi:hypothetical protein